LHGFGFGGEWAAGAVLMGEVIRDKYRGRAVGLVQTGWAIGWGLSALVYTAVYWMCPEWLAWRVLFAIGLVPAVFVIWVRRHIEDSDIYRATREARGTVGFSHLFSAFRGVHLATTVKVSLMVAGAQGSGYAIGIWMPTYLRTVRHFSATATGGVLLLQILGALCGFLLGSYLSDAIGRKQTFMWSAILSLIFIAGFIWIPMNDTWLLIMGVPLNVVLLMKFPPMGPFMTELFPTELRGNAQGFCYNSGRAIGSFFPTLVGFVSESWGLGNAIAICSVVASGIMIVVLLTLPETRGRAVANIGEAAAAE